MADEKGEPEKFRLRDQAGNAVGEIDLTRRVGTLKTGAMNAGQMISVSMTPVEDEDGEEELEQ